MWADEQVDNSMSGGTSCCSGMMPPVASIQLPESDYLPALSARKEMQ
jgi:hypothetical protein